PGSVELDEDELVVANERVEGLGGEGNDLLCGRLVVGIDTGLNPIDDSLFVSASIVIRRFSSLLPELESGISLDVVLLAHFSLHCAIDLGKRRIQLVRSLLVFGREVLAVT
ncbi:hypothetical protein PFISCL1PPCAC_10871, partial [Pristionchus fissidentatus]